MENKATDNETSINALHRLASPILATLISLINALFLFNIMLFGFYVHDFMYRKWHSIPTNENRRTLIKMSAQMDMNDVGSGGDDEDDGGNDNAHYIEGTP